MFTIDSLITSLSLGKSLRPFGTRAFDLHIDHMPPNAFQNLRFKHAAFRERAPKFAHRSCISHAYLEICEFSDNRASKRDARLTGWFPNTNKNRGLQRMHFGYNGERKSERERERRRQSAYVCVYNVAWQQIHVRVIHFREPREHSCWSYV